MEIHGVVIVASWLTRATDFERLYCLVTRLYRLDNATHQHRDHQTQVWVCNCDERRHATGECAVCDHNLFLALMMTEEHCDVHQGRFSVLDCSTTHDDAARVQYAPPTPPLPT
jgi:hypothetical protein